MLWILSKSSIWHDLSKSFVLLKYVCLGYWRPWNCKSWPLSDEQRRILWRRSKDVLSVSRVRTAPSVIWIVTTRTTVLLYWFTSITHTITVCPVTVCCCDIVDKVLLEKFDLIKLINTHRRRLKWEEGREEESYTDHLKHPSVKFEMRVVGMADSFKKEMNILLWIYNTLRE